MVKAPAATKATKALEVKEAVTEVVVRADPKRPPFGLLALQAAWGGGALSICGHCHSTLRRRPSEGLLRRFDATPASALITVRVVWREGPTETAVLAAGQALRGEANMLRLLSRLGPSMAPEALEPQQAARLDALLDSVEGGLETVEAAPGGWMLPWGPSIADAALWSRLKAPDAPRCPPKLAAWLKKCDNAFSPK